MRKQGVFCLVMRRRDRPAPKDEECEELHKKTQRFCSSGLCEGQFFERFRCRKGGTVVPKWLRWTVCGEASSVNPPAAARRRSNAGRFRYDAMEYSLNFDDGVESPVFHQRRFGGQGHPPALL